MPLPLQTAALLSAVDSVSMRGLNQSRHRKQDHLPRDGIRAPASAPAASQAPPKDAWVLQDFSGRERDSKAYLVINVLAFLSAHETLQAGNVVMGLLCAAVNFISRKPYQSKGAFTKEKKPSASKDPEHEEVRLLPRPLLLGH